MKLTLLGTGSPIPLLERMGTSMVLEVGDASILLDCGPGTTHRLVRFGIHPQALEWLFFTHHHMDHNADFFHFAIASWSLGRDALTVVGPSRTEQLLEALYTIYEEDLAYRSELFYPETGIYDIDWIETHEDLRVEGAGWVATAMPVEHSIETFAYRFDEPATGASMVFSGDTRYLPALGEFAADVDVLVQDCSLGPVTNGVANREGLVWHRLAAPMSEDRRDLLHAGHCTPAEAGQLAALAGAKTLVLTHILPYRDTDAMSEEAAAHFDGRVIAGRDGLTLEAPTSG